MKRFTLISTIVILALTSCANDYLELQSKEELVVEGWIEDGHAPMVMVSSTLPVSSTPQPISNIQDHILRYAEVYIENNGVRTYLTARLSDKYTIQNYFTSSTLRGEVGQSYTLHVKWLDYEASATCTIPEPTPIDTSYFVKEKNDTSYIAKIEFKNNPDEGKYYQSFRRIGAADTTSFSAVNFSTMNGKQLDKKITMVYMKPVTNNYMNDCYFHPGEIVAIKLATMQECMYNFWSQFTNAYNSTGTMIQTAPYNIYGNVNGAIGYWAGYGISIVEMTVPGSAAGAD